MTDSGWGGGCGRRLCPEGIKASPGGLNQELNSSVSQTPSALETKRRDSSKWGGGLERDREGFLAGEGLEMEVRIRLAERGNCARKGQRHE